MKLTRGTLKVIVTGSKAIVENATRARNRGRIFIPPYVIYEYSEETKAVDIHYAFGVKARSLVTRYNLTSFPYAWAPRPLQDIRCWLETTDEATLVTNHIEE
jgi:hypothetical protein